MPIANHVQRVYNIAKQKYQQPLSAPFGNREGLFRVFMEDIITCEFCGREKRESEFYDRPTGLSRYCIACEEAIYERLSEREGAYIALFAMCCSANVPFIAEVLPEKEEFCAMEDRWVWYNDRIADEIHSEDGKILGFFDGETSIMRIFGKNLTQEDVAEYVKYSQKIEAALPGTREQRSRWGTEPLCKGCDMTKEVYDELDRQYDIWVGRYRGQTITPQLADSIVQICRWNMVVEHLLRVGEYLAAQKVRTMVDNLMASEQMRKKDEKPLEGMRIDAMVTAFEQLGAMEQNQFKSFPEIVEIFWKRFFKKKKYSYSVDAADHMIFDYYNNLRINAEQPTVGTLPADMKLEDDLGEFEEEASEEEKKRERFAGVTSVVFDEEEDES